MNPDKNDINKKQQDNLQEKGNDRGEINLGGRQFTGDSTDQETSSTGLPTVSDHPAVDERDNKNSETAEKS